MGAQSKTLTRYEGPGEVQLDQRTLMEASSLNVQTRSNSNPVQTMKKGFSGRSRGPTQTQIRVQSAIPKAGFEVDVRTKIVVDADVTITWIEGGQRWSVDGYVDEMESEHNSASAATMSFTVMGGTPRLLSR